MTGNAQKLPLARSLNRLAERKVYEVFHNTGKALPCSVVAVTNSIVTVKFEVQNTPFTLPQVTCPMFGPEYIRYPTQIGDKGVVFAADAYLGGMTALGGGVADLAIRGNLSCLVFFPVGNNDWSNTDNANAVVLYGPDGVILRDTNKKTLVSVDGSGHAKIHGLKSYSWDVNGYGTKVTYNGGSSFTVDNYVTGASVTTNNLPWVAPGPIA